MTLLLLGAGIPAPVDETTPARIYEIAFGHTWQDEDPTWTDVTQWVDDSEETTISRGRSADLDTFQTGSAGFTLLNDDRRFDPFHTGPYYGQLLPNVPVRIRATYGVSYDLFRGFVDGWPQTYTTGNRIASVRVAASDAFKMFSQLDLLSAFFTLDSATLGVLDQNRLGGSGLSVSELSGARIETLLDLAAWPVSQQDVSAGATLCQAQETDDSVLDAMKIVEKSEDGFLYIEADGDVTFVGRHERQTNARMSTSVVEFSDADNDFPYQDLHYRYDDQLIYNDVRRTREDGEMQTAEDQASIDAYFRKVNAQTGLVMDTDLVARDLAVVFLNRYKDPILRIDTLVIDPGNNRANLFPQVLGRRILDRITVERTPQEQGSAISQALLVQGIRHIITEKRWKTTFYVTPADTTMFFTLDDPFLGVLDEDLIGA